MSILNSLICCRMCACYAHMSFSFNLLHLDRNLYIFIIIYRNKKIRNYDPINDELLDDHHDNWVLEDSPPFLTVEELESLRNDLANMTIQPISDDIGMHVFFL